MIIRKKKTYFAFSISMISSKFSMILILNCLGVLNQYQLVKAMRVDADSITTFIAFI